MVELQACPVCGQTVPEGTAQGQCPSCLLGLALALPEDPRTATGPSLRLVGDYELLEEIGRGGMGVVFKARQRRLNRMVALKLILTGPFASQQEVRRFRSEAEVAANLRHPNIVAVYETGDEAGQHFLSMEYVEGRGLAELAREGPLSALRAAQYVRGIARAIHFAHQQGVLHRDLKPSNVLIDALDQPRITDFGLAKRLPSESEIQNPKSKIDLTLSGQMLGSPHFMPPEQAIAPPGELGPPSDVYSLGAILYHLLVGRPPFQAPTLDAVLVALRVQEPVAPRLLNSGVPRDLETICLKCLEKTPGRRYATAEALADELDRFLRDEPILARPTGPMEKAWRWCRRKPGLAVAMAAALVLLLVVAVGSPIASLRINRERQRVQQNLVRQYVASGTRLMNDGDLFGSLLWYAEALRRDAGNVQREEPHRIRIASVLRRCPKLLNVFAHGTMVYHEQFSPDAHLVVTAGDDDTARVWDLCAGNELRVLRHEGDVYHAAFSPDGQRIVTASQDRSARVWSVTNGVPLTPPLRHRDKVWRACFSPDGRLVATAGEDRTAQLWDAATGQRVGPTLPHDSPVARVTFSPDGRLLATADRWDYLLVWEVATGRRLFQGRHQAYFTETSFSPDSRRFLTGDGSNLRVWDTDTFHEAAFSPLEHGGQINAAVFSPDGRFIVGTSEQDNTTRVWDAATGRPVFSPALRHKEYNLTISFSPDSRRVVTANEDNTAQVWSAHSGQPRCPPLKHILMVKHAAFDATGRRLLVNSCDQAARVWDLATSETRAPSAPSFSGLPRFLSPQGDRLILIGESNVLWIADTRSNTPVAALPHPSRATYATFSPDGGTVFTACQEANQVSSTRSFMFLWNAATGRRLNRVTMESAFQVHCAAFSPDGRSLVTGGQDYMARLWNARTGESLAPPMRHGHRVSWASFSPDGRQIATACWDQTVRVWDAATGRPITAPLLHNKRVSGAVWSADSKRLHTVTDDYRLQVWDLANSEPLAPPLKIDEPGSSRDNEALTVPSKIQNPKSKIQMSLLTPAATEEDLRPDERPVQDLVLLAQMLAVGRVDGGGDVVPLQLNELTTAWATLRRKYPRQFAATSDEVALWHRRESADCEATGDWRAARFHLDRALEASPGTGTELTRRSRNDSAGDGSPHIPSRDPRAGMDLVDLGLHYNLSLRESLSQKPDGNNLAALPAGLRTFGDVRFDVRGIVHLSGQGANAVGIHYPERRDGIRIGRRCQKLHFLQATSWDASNGTQVGTYVLHYADGQRRDLAIIRGRDTKGWWGMPSRPKEPGHATVVWAGHNRASLASAESLRLFKSTRQNPVPDVQLVSIDFVSSMEFPAPFLVALTVE